jgi:exosortase A-associated hydrolase 2
MAPQPEPFFLSVEPGRLGERFAVYHAPHAGPARGLVVYVHPLAEEMNKSRRMAALQSRALAAEDFAVLQLDLLGCGDSAGDFGDATWPRWVDDVVAACRWLRHRHEATADEPVPRLLLWGLRVGCLVAVEAASALDEACDFLFWQPTLAGNTALQQFLRMKLVGDMVAGHAKGAMAALREQLAAGRHAEIAGYALNPSLAVGLERAVLRPAPRLRRVDWLELTASLEAVLSPASSRVAEQWKEAGCDLRVQLVQGPAFWQTTEIEEAPELLARTSAALLHRAHPPDTRAGSPRSRNASLPEVAP